MSSTRLFALLLVVLGIGAGVSGQVGSIPPGGQQPQPPPVGTGFIAGQVIDAATGRPIPEAQVSTIGRSTAAGGRVTVQPGITTDEQGRFFFRNLLPGLYTLTAGKAGYGPARGGSTTIELGDAERVMDTRVRLARLASVSGRVRDAAGDPVVGTEILAFRRTVVNGRPGFQSAMRGVRTDDRGAYRIPGITAGDYFICACLRDPNPLDGLLLTTLASEPVNLMMVAARALTVGADVVSLDDTLRTYPPTFFPNSLTVSRASRVTLAAGEDKTGVDINVELVRATRVSGSIAGAQSSIHASSIRLVPAADAEAGIELTQISPMLVQADGRFDFASVPPGQYRLIVTHRETGATGGGPSGLALGFAGGRASSPPSPPVAMGGPGVTPPPVLWSNDVIPVGDGGIRGLVVTLAQGPVVTGRLQFIGSSPQPAEQMLTRFSVVLQPVVIPAGPSSFSPAIGPVSANGTFRVVGAVPGKYTVSFASSPWGLRSVTLGGVDITDLPIEVGGKDLADLVLTLVDTPLGSLMISVPAPSGQRPDDEAVVVFPADRKYWAEPAAARRRLRTATLSTKGTATVADLPAGDYLLVLVAGENAVDWQDPASLDALSRRAQRVALNDGEKRTIEVRR